MNKCKKKFIIQAILWLSTCVLICAIFYLSGQDGAASHSLSRRMVREASELIELPGIVKHYIVKLDLSYDIILRKIAHFSLFFILSPLLYFAIKSITRKYVKILTIKCCIVFAGIDEYHQVFIAGRSARFTDFMFDAAGIICGMLLVAVSAGIWRVSRKTREHGGYL